jgi:hypothetical protein
MIHPRSILLMLLLIARPASAFPTEGPSTFCDAYPSAPACTGGTASCLMCHSAPPTLNLYGAQVRDSLEPGEREEGLPAALAAVESLDADDDGWTNLQELLLGTLPGDPLSAHEPVTPSAEAIASTTYTLGEYDAAFALRRLKVAFCGVGPSFEEVQLAHESEDPRSWLHDVLDECLAADYWRREAVPRLADARVRPLVALGTCENLMADFEYDYRLFTYAMTGGRDARDILVADYHVGRDASGELMIIDEAKSPLVPPASRAQIACSDPFGNSPPLTGGQALTPAHRAGMLTMQWFLVIQTQASYLPRTTAAAAYRGWLGYDISRFEGLFPVAEEPRDIDDIGIAQSPCYQCHSTLDPLAYSFAYYNGIGFEGIPGQSDPTIGTYDRARPTTFFQGPEVARNAWSQSPPTPYALGEPMPAEATLGSSTSLVHMARALSSSDAFASNIADMVWTIAVGQSPGPGEHDEFATVVDALRGADYSVDALAHAIIDTHAFGAP